MEMIQPTAKHQATFKSFNLKESCEIAFGTTTMYWLAFACIFDS